MSQIVLPLTLGRSADSLRIVTGNANRAAVDALAEPAGWPFRTAILAGPPRSGRSLLGRWFEQTGGGAFVDDADRLDETELFHRWNRAQEEGETLLLAGPASGWTIALPDLRSRLGAALHLEIGTPDDDMLASLIEAHAQQRGLALGEGALTYLVPRATRSFAAIEKLVEEIDRLTLERKVPATLAIWRAALDAVEGPEQASLL
ncbi:HdaA/DnaA family protein [Qipengyuania oceanensis]|uniref:HdaA/DnaA family protein n=1 Tax=Qipengyuania oceanensis TaxID=1463597 RepID=UPI003B01D300